MCLLLVFQTNKYIQSFHMTTFSTDELDVKRIYTFLGIFDDDNTFIRADTKVIRCMAYRHLRLEIVRQLAFVNIKYVKDFVNAWVIFQVVLAPKNTMIE